MPEIVISEFMDAAGVEALAARYSTLYAPDLPDRPEDLSAAVAETRALVVRNRTRIGDALIAAAPHLTCIGRLGVGLDNIDLAACAARGIRVYPATGANDLAVAEYVVTMALTLLRGSFGLGAAMRAGAWPRERAIGREAAGKRLGLVGFGAIARLTATRARAMGFAVAAFDPLLAAEDPAWGEVERLDFPALLARSDVVSLHVPLTQATRRMLDAAALAQMKPDAVVINAARGGVLDEAALAAALRAGRLAGAALDVFETEPLTAEAAACFDGLETLILTPHIAGVSVESNVRVSRVTAETVLRHLEVHP